MKANTEHDGGILEATDWPITEERIVQHHDARVLQGKAPPMEYRVTPDAFDAIAKRLAAKVEFGARRSDFTRDEWITLHGPRGSTRVYVAREGVPDGAIRCIEWPKVATPLTYAGPSGSITESESFSDVLARSTAEPLELPPPTVRGLGADRLYPAAPTLRREAYTRAVAMFGDVEVIPGVELRDGERLEEQIPNVRACAQNAIGVIGRAIATLDDKRPAMVHAQRIATLTEGYITTRFPGRMYFVEVGNDREGWIQVCTPPPGPAPGEDAAFAARARRVGL